MSMPKGWEEVRLGDIANIQRGASPRPISDTIWFDDNSDVSWVRISDVNGKYLTKTEQYLSQKGIEKSRFVDVNTVIMSMCATLGRPTITKVKACIHDGFVCFNNLKTDTDFLYYFLQSIENSWKMQGQTGSQANLNTEIIKNVKIKLPPLKEQEKIAEILSSCDEHIKNLKNLKSELEKEKLHLMNELLSGKTRFSSFTTPWQEVTLADICDIQKGQQLNKLNLQENGKFPVINGGIEPSGYYDEFNTQENTITISEGGNSCGYVNFLTTKFWSGGHCYALQNVKIDNKFLYFYLKYQEKDIMKLRLGSGLPNIQKGSISAVIIKYPSLEEQKKIGEVLSACDERLECLNELITAQTTLKSHLLTELLSGNIRVNA